MKFSALLLFICVFNCALTKGQEYVVKGTYQGKNIYVINPAIDTTGEVYCVKAVYVNDILTDDEIRSNSFEIDFSNLKLTDGQKVTIKITHHEGCRPEIINANVLESTTVFAFNTPKIDKKSNKLNWTITGVIDDKPFFIEQFRWGKWITVGEVYPRDSIGENNFLYEPRFNTKYNVFRIKHIDKSGVERISKECKYFSKDEELYLISARVSDWIYFSSETLYEIYDEKGNFILDGYGKEVNITDIDKGKYWVNYDNRTEMVTKK